MRIIEEANLKETITSLNEYQNSFSSLAEMYDKLLKFKIGSLQDVSYKKDSEFFGEISFVLSVIITIIMNPKITSMDKDELIRADLAGHIENDSFQMVFKDARLWKEKDYQMVPENVYYHEHIDEIKIYENIFIGMLINLISDELNTYNDFYISLLPTFGKDEELISSTDVTEALKVINNQIRKITFIKNTYFYKQIKKCNLNLRKIEPTNILLKNKLYNYCFKFYKKFIHYVDKKVAVEDFKYYCYMLVLKNFRKREFEIDSSNSKDFNNLCFNYKDYVVDLNMNTDKPIISLNIKCKSAKASHNLECSIERKIDIETGDFSQETDEIVTLWNLYDSKTKKQLNTKKLSEEDLIGMWIDSKFEEIIADKNIYSNYCPICKSKTLDEKKNVYTCMTCDSKYLLKKVASKYVMWFIRVRRP